MNRMLVFILCVLLAPTPITYGQAPADLTRDFEGSVYRDPVRSIGLNNIVASDLAETLSAQFDGIRFSGNDQFRRIYFRCSEDLYKEVVRLVNEIEGDAQRFQDESRERIMEDRAREQESWKTQQEEFPLRIYALRHVPAEDIRSVLQEIGLPDQLKLTVHPNGDSILARGPGQALEFLNEILTQLDRPKMRNENTAFSMLNAVMADSDLERRGLTRDPSDTRDVPTLSRRLAEIQEETRDLLAQVANREGDSEDSIRDALANSIRAEFMARQEMQLAQIHAQRERLEALERRVRNRTELLDEIIENRLSQLLQDREGVWAERFRLMTDDSESRFDSSERRRGVTYAERDEDERDEDGRDEDGRDDDEREFDDDDEAFDDRDDRRDFPREDRFRRDDHDEDQRDTRDFHDDEGHDDEGHDDERVSDDEDEAFDDRDDRRDFPHEDRFHRDERDDDERDDDERDDD